MFACYFDLISNIVNIGNRWLVSLTEVSRIGIFQRICVAWKPAALWDFQRSLFLCRVMYRCLSLHPYVWWNRCTQKPWKRMSFDSSDGCVTLWGLTPPAIYCCSAPDCSYLPSLYGCYWPVCCWFAWVIACWFAWCVSSALCRTPSVV